MNWRNTTSHQDRYYNHPAVPNLFTNFTAWFDFLKSKKLRTYFNDHPFPVASRAHLSALRSILGPSSRSPAPSSAMVT